MMIDLPLYRDNHEPRPLGHLGLFHDKFFNAWFISPGKVQIKEPEGDYLGGKLEWLKRVALKTGDEKRLGEAIRRREKLLGRLNGMTCKYRLQSPFVTGMGYEHPVENGFVWHPTLGVPCLPASGVKGLIRAWARDCLDEAEGGGHVARICGDADKAGAWIFFDALPVGPAQLAPEVMTPHDGGWRISDNPDVTPSDWVSPNPIPFLVVKPGASFQFAFAPRRGAVEGDDALIQQWLETALDYLGAGAKTAVGFGRFSSAG